MELGDAPTVTMAMFPLGTVLFPYALLPLHVFEPRYRMMMNHVLAGDREFGVVLIERGSEVGGGDTRFDVATIARVVQSSELPDGRFALATVGMRRVRVVRWLADDPYPRAEVAALVDPPATDDDIAARDRAVAALAELTELARRIDPRVAEPPTLDADPVRRVLRSGGARAGRSPRRAEDVGGRRRGRPVAAVLRVGRRTPRRPPRALRSGRVTRPRRMGTLPA